MSLANGTPKTKELTTDMLHDLKNWYIKHARLKAAIGADCAVAGLADQSPVFTKTKLFVEADSTMEVTSVGPIFGKT